ncbi:hypothetical protein ACFLSX_00980 [Calditrichota bacterium]
MSIGINIKEIEKKVWQLNYEDGITDITIGLVLVVSTICQMFSDVRFVLYSLYLLPVLFSVLAKRYISAPRIGSIKFNQTRIRKRYLLSIIITTFIVLMLMLTFEGFFSAQLSFAPFIIGLIVLLICSSIAFVLNYNRMFIYGILITLSFALSEFRIYQTGSIPSGAFAWLISAIIIIAVGIYYLIKFIQRYPIAVSGDSYGQQ